MPDLTGKRALVTGGLGTIGRALVAGFLREGADVTVLDRPGGQPPDGTAWIGADLADLKAATGAVTAAMERDGPFDILVSNAALIVNKPFEDFSLDEYEEQVRVNASALFALTKACAPAMRAQGWGRILCMSSVTLTGQWHGYVPYVASKGALVGLVKALARELGADGITVNAIAPGAVRSEAEDRVFADKLQEYQDWIIKNQCLKARIEAEDVAELALFLASDRARMITGQNVHVDGGW
jgi:NAD(P)-dependent dehydrogenase (short-subunit alcohol dehydrogenase family)